MRNHRTNPSSGFTLIELTIVVTILSLMAAGVMAAMRIHIAGKTITDTRDRISTIKGAMVAFKQKNGRLPCPAAMNAAPGSAKFGIEDSDSCAAGTPPTTWAGATVRVTNAAAGNNPARIGAVPFLTLGISSQDSVDGWNNRYLYAVSEKLADKTIPYDENNGAITLTDGATPPNVSGPNPNHTPFVLISMGEAGYGGYTYQGVPRGTTPCTAAGTPQQTNCDMADAAFRSMPYANTTNAASGFDNILTADLGSNDSSNIGWEEITSNTAPFEVTCEYRWTEEVSVPPDFFYPGKVTKDWLWVDYSGSNYQQVFSTNKAKTIGDTGTYAARTYRRCPGGAASSTDPVRVCGNKGMLYGPGHAKADASGCVPNMVEAANGFVGIGTATPVVKLDVAGAVKIGAVPDADCTAATVGAARYAPAPIDAMQYCAADNGTAVAPAPPVPGWKSFGGGTMGPWTDITTDTAPFDTTGNCEYMWTAAGATFLPVQLQPTAIVSFFPSTAGGWIQVSSGTKNLTLIQGAGNYAAQTYRRCPGGAVGGTSGWAFGGMYELVSPGNCAIGNVLTGNCTCPSGFAAVTVANQIPGGFSILYCYK